MDDRSIDQPRVVTSFFVFLRVRVPLGPSFVKNGEFIKCLVI